MHCLVFTETDLYNLTKGKSYLAKQKWSHSTCLRDQCYDVGCHPCEIILFCFKEITLVLRFNSFFKHFESIFHISHVYTVKPVLSGHSKKTKNWFSRPTIA